MKIRYFLLFTIFVGGSVAAQNVAPQLPVDQRVPMPYNKKAYVGDEPVLTVPVNNMRPGEITVNQNRDVTVVEEIIGLTVYDLQSNASVQRRMIDSDGERRAAWTYGLNPSAFSDRGTGYNEYVNGEWNEEPYERLESIRTGWPGLLETGSGRVVIINHASINTPLHVTYRDAGSSSWVESDLPLGNAPGQLWPRAAAGGTDGNTIHVICLTTPEANDGAIYNGQDGALVYLRSEDAGDSWNVVNYQHPEMDETNFLGFGGDSYAIDARGDKVAFAVFNDLADSFVMISDDNGETWVKRILVDFPVDLYVVDSGLPDSDTDWNEDGIFEEHFNTDGAGDVIIDHDGNVHVFFGEMYYADTDLTDGGFQFYPGVNGLAYWNDSMMDEEYETIAFTYDLDENGTLDLDGIASYFTNLASMPSAGITADGHIYVTYSAVVESHSTGLLNYRQLYVVRSLDGGATWSTTEACNLTPDVDFDFFENVFGAINRDIDGHVRIVFQRDFEPGLHIRGEEHQSVINDIVYLGVALDQFDACESGEDIEYVSIEEPLDERDVEIYPNPANSVVNIVINKLGTAQLRIFDMNGRIVYEHQNAQTLTRFDSSDLARGTYLVQVMTERGVLNKKLIIE